MRVLIDCDGPLSDFVGLFIQKAKEIYDVDIDKNQITTFNIEDCTPITKEQFLHICGQKGFCYSIKPVDGAINAVNELKNIGCEVFCVTAPMLSDYWVVERIAWLKEYFGIDISHQVHTSAKYLICGDYFIDDNVGNVNLWTKHNDGKAFLWNAPYNFACDNFDGNVLRVNDWKTIINIIKEKA